VSNPLFLIARSDLMFRKQCYKRAYQLALQAKQFATEWDLKEEASFAQIRCKIYRALSEGKYGQQTQLFVSRPNYCAPDRHEKVCENEPVNCRKKQRKCGTSIKTVIYGLLWLAFFVSLIFIFMSFFCSSRSIVWPVCHF
jgi:hypothetical protein